MPIKKKEVRKLSEECYFKQFKGTPQADEAKALIIPFKLAAGKNRPAVNKTIISVSQNGDFVLLSYETLKAIVAWYANAQ